MDNRLNHYKEQLLDFSIAYGGKILFAVLLVLFGPSIIRKLTRFVEKKVAHSNIDKDVKPFLISLINVGLNLSILIVCASIMGIQTTSFVAVLGAAGLAVGLALQGSLANFAGGVLILVFKPFQVGDIIAAQGFTGTVSAVRIFDTILLTGENKTVILPNGPLSTSPIVNFSDKGSLQIEIPLKISNEYTSETVKDCVESALKNLKIILEKPANEFVISSVSKKYVNYHIKCWVWHKNQGKAIAEILPQLQEVFSKAGIKFSANNSVVK
jgi:small conductance mechanosensitive channel